MSDARGLTREVPACLSVCHRDEANKYSQEELRLMKTQDVAYLNLKSQTEARVRSTLQITVLHHQMHLWW